MANHEIVPTSAFTKGTAERKKSATSFSLPGFASSGTYSANFVITFSCFDRGHQARRPATRISHPRHCPLSSASLSQTTLVKARERECFLAILPRLARSCANRQICGERCYRPPSEDRCKAEPTTAICSRCKLVIHSVRQFPQKQIFLGARNRHSHSGVRSSSLTRRLRHKCR